MKYAKNTKVSVDKSKGEIEKILIRYGASQFAYATKEDQAVVIFQVNDKRVRFNLPLPDFKEFEQTKRGKRSRDKIIEIRDQACKARWRALALVIKAKLEAVDSGITIFEEEFLAHLVTSGGQTVGERILPDLKDVLKKAINIPLLPGVGA